ncbi:MAG: TerB family tellurite resistance protein [Deltaproteobacteria bacterium]|nr:TerB family tellurite resistance protein [Deltaproteobacteria bacterium]
MKGWKNTYAKLQGAKMISHLRAIFEKGNTKGSDTRDRASEDDIRMATCALLLELSHIDGKFSERERDLIIDILQRKYGLDQNKTVSLMEAARSELKDSIDLWQFTNLINENYTIEEKIGVIEMVWRIAYRDHVLDKHEDYLLHKLAKLLHLSHNKLIDAKMKVLKENACT